MKEKMNREHSCIINKWLRWWCLGNISCLDESFSKCGSQTSSISITWGLLKMQILGQPRPTPDLLSQKLEVRRAICVYQVFPESWHMINLRTTGFRDMSNLAHSLFFVSQISLETQPLSFIYILCRLLLLSQQQSLSSCREWTYSQKSL